MANKDHLDILKQGVEVWNVWRQQHPDIQPDLYRVDLSEANLTRVDLSEANLLQANLFRTRLSEARLTRADLSGADLSEANLYRADLSEANLYRAVLEETNFSGADLSGADLNDTHLIVSNLSGANLSGADLIRANLSGANLSGASFMGTNLSGADLTGANLSGADLSRTVLVFTNLTNITLEKCNIYGIGVWDVQLDGAKQLNLTITPKDQPAITVDNLKVAQFIYLLLNNKEIREVIDTITSKVVLILGRFTPERKAILDTLRDELRKRNYTPVLFDFEKPVSRDITETVSTLALMARFVIADITEPKSIPQELQAIVPYLPSVPIQPLLQVSDREYGMFEHFVSYPWMQPIYRYHDVDELLQSLREQIIDPAERKVKELALEKAKRLEKP